MLRFDPDTGQGRVFGSVHERAVSLSTLREVFSGAEGDKLMSEIAQDSIMHGQRTPIAIRALRNIRDKETKEAETAAHNVEYLRKVRLQREKMTGVITEEEYKKQLHEGALV
jgi:hypothetical protein